MLDPVIQFFTRVFEAIGRGIGWVIAALLWPFVAMSRWYTKRGWIVRGSVGLVLFGIVAGYFYFLWNTQRWASFDPDYIAKYDFANRTVEPGEPLGQGQNGCGRSAMVEVTADLISFNVDENNWVPSMLLSKAGLFGIPWKNTPFFDNKAAFQLGINQVLRRTSVELVDTLGRARGTSQIDQNLQDARGNLAYDEEAWYFSLSPIGPQIPAQSRYREARKNLLAFNDRLAACQATFDPRADNLLQFFDRVASDIGSTSDILRARMEASNAGWFDPRADDRFWFAYGQLYAYHGILNAARADFRDTFVERNITRVWDRTAEQLRSALNMTPAIISNSSESSWIMPSHLATMGFYLLRVRSNMVEIRSILDR